MFPAYKFKTGIKNTPTGWRVFWYNTCMKERRKKITCEFCGSDKVKEYLYGDLPAEAFEEKDFDKKYIAAGGVLIKNQSPKYYCKACKKDFGQAE